MSTVLSSAVTRAGATIGSNATTQQARRGILDGERLPIQSIRPLTAGEFRPLLDDLRAGRDAQSRKLVAKAQRQTKPLVDGILSILRQSSTYRGRTAFDDPVAMAPLREGIQRAVQRGATLQLVLPLGGGKVENPTKTGDVTLPDLGEWLAFLRLDAMAQAIGQLHPPGARVVLIPDAPLHTADIGFSYSAVTAHIDQAQRDLVTLGADQRVFVPDTAKHLPPQWFDEVAARTEVARSRIATDPAFAANAEAQVQSLQFSMNTRVFGWTEEHTVLVTAELAAPDPDTPTAAREDAGELRALTERVVPHYIAVNQALRSLDVPRRLTESLFGDSESVRLTVHAKPGEPRPQLVPSGRHARPGLLPMHSVGMRWLESDRARYAGLFALEARMAGMPLRVTEEGRPLFFDLGSGLGVGTHG